VRNGVGDWWASPPPAAKLAIGTRSDVGHDQEDDFQRPSDASLAECGATEPLECRLHMGDVMGDARHAIALKPREG
jgi:hypothetical protein